MGTTIDSLQIEIQSSSDNAAGGIDRLASSLERLKKVGSFNVAIKNLNNLSSALDKLQNSSTGLTNLNTLASSLESIKKAGSLGSISNSFVKLGNALKDLEKINIDNVVSKIKELNEKVGPVSQKLAAIGNAFKQVNSKSLTASSGFSVFGGKVNTTTLNLSSLINVLRGVKSVLSPVVNLMRDAISEAIEWDGISQRFGRGFGEQAEEVYSWVQRLNKEMGINTQQFMQYSSTYATMLSGFGVSSKDASEMALGYMELTYDIWSGYNDIYKSMDDAATAVRSAIAGEVEPIRKAGFTIIESTLEQTAANRGLKISLENATEAQKSYLRYLTLVDQAKAQKLVGNYAKELNTAEGLIRTFSQQLKTLAQTFGSVLLPVLVRVMPTLQEFVSLLGDAIISMATLLGVDIQKANFGGSLNGIGESADSATNSINNTKEAVKELKNATVGIDELNIISPQTQGGGSGSGGTGTGTVGAEIGSLWDESIFEGIENQTTPIDKAVASLAGFALAVSAVVKAWKFMKPVIEGIKEYVAAVKAMTPEVGFLSAAFPKLSGATASASTTFTKFIGSVKSVVPTALSKVGTAFKAAGGSISGFASSIGSALGLSGGAAVAAGAAVIVAAIAAVIGTIVFLKKHWDEVTAAVKRFFNENIVPKINSIKESFDKIKDALGGLLDALGPIGDAIRDVVDYVVDFISQIDILKGLGAVFEKIGEIVVYAFGGAIAGAFQGCIGVIESFVQAIAGVVEIVSGFVEAIVRLFSGDLQGAWDAVKQIGRGIFDVFAGLYGITIGAVIDFVHGVISWFVDLWDELVGHSIVPDTIDGIVKCFTGLPGRVLGVVGTFVGNVIGKFSDFGSKLVSKISSGWDSVKKWWSNNVKLSIPSLSLKVTYTTSGLGTIKKAVVKALGLQGWPKISFAANGGIFDMGSLVWAGESGPEIVANAGGGKTGVMNVQQMSEAVYEGVYTAVVAAMRANGGNSGNTQDVNVYLDGKQIYSSMEQHRKERGASLMGNQVYAY